MSFPTKWIGTAKASLSSSLTTRSEGHSFSNISDDSGNNNNSNGVALDSAAGSEEAGLSIDDIVRGNFPAVQLPMTTQSVDEEDLDIQQYEVDQAIENYEEDAAESDASSYDVEEMRETIEYEVDKPHLLLSTSWAEGLSIKSIGLNEEADGFFADRAADAHDIERPDSTPPDFAVPTISGDVDDGYLADETQDMIWERYAPYGNTILRRVRPVFAREARAVLVPQNSCCDLKWLVLFLVCLINFGNFLNFDIISALNDDLKTTLDVKDPQMGLLYSAYTAPNCIVVILGGMFVDRFGLRLGAIIFSLVVVVGCSLVALSTTNTWFHSYYTTLLGRFIYGLGGESLYVAADAIVIDYFDQHQLSRVMTAASTFLNLGDFATFSALPTVADYYNVSTALWFGVGMCILSFIAVCIYCIVDFFVDRSEQKTEKIEALIQELFDSDASEDTDSDDGTDSSLFESEHERAAPPTYHSIHHVAGAINHDVEERSPLLRSAHGSRRPSALSSRQLHTPLYRRLIRRVRRVFDSRFWFMAMTSWSLTGAYETFSGFAPDLLEKRFDLSQTQASLTISIMSVSVLVATPVMGLICSRMRQPSIIALIVFGLLFMSGSHVYLALSPEHFPIIPAIIMIGFAYSLLSSAVFPSMPLVVQEKYAGTAYGCLYAGQNAINSVLYYAAGHAIHDSPITVSFMWAGVAFFGSFASFLWLYSTCRASGGIWNCLTSPKELVLKGPCGAEHIKAKREH
mmetsp:Transcript_19557/g.33613  ORF Transcript_19557/g.33613 Transcript_19557/m.33613 type:complete len:742 (-) Transcript_19557:919-3144(-)|eukprot:CAMPEP_0168600356 /NCGR_PEP_ID=MMETSP0420-20121227/12725_1 /TAXON_ID=498008 /ORGANISM="Pessonella sp." /LENGTH=741 /DNA_ID=CAMNT_0008638411 /DNA_START=87 /DNA_END=2312 /DNA_ORIENTATION=+